MTAVLMSSTCPSLLLMRIPLAAIIVTARRREIASTGLKNIAAAPLVMIVAAPMSAFPRQTKHEGVERVKGAVRPGKDSGGYKNG